MSLNKKPPSIVEVKEMDLVDYLSSLGYQPNKINNADYWYLSPLRNERTPSFKVNKKMNRWYDHGLGKGGNIIDFGILYHNCPVGEFLSKLSAGFSFHQPVLRDAYQQKNESKMVVLQDFPLGSVGLVKYLNKRKIPIGIAEQYCREIQYSLNDKTYYAIGFKNDAGGH